MDNESDHEQKKAWSLRTLAWLSIGGILFTYLVIVPTADAFLQKFREQPSVIPATDLDRLSSYVYELQSSWYLQYSHTTGHVLQALSMLSRRASHRGASVTTRASACPACGMTISRIDNLPLFSYLNLGGRCRNCLSAIPIRYFLTELIGATIFGSLFLFELVTGATNVPEFKRYFYAGILWIILYTKWPVIGIYLYHAALFSCLLMLSLMDLDRLRCPKWLSGIILCIFAGLSIGIPTLQPVKFYHHLPTDLVSAIPPSMLPIVTCVAGGLIGWFFASIIQYLCSRSKLTLLHPVVYFH